MTNEPFVASDSQVDALCLGYGVRDPLIFTGEYKNTVLKNSHVLRNGDYAIIVTDGLDTLSVNGTEIAPFTAFDDLLVINDRLDLVKYTRSDMYWTHDSLPVLSYQNTTIDLDRYVNQIRVKPSTVRGAAYSEVSITRSNITLADAEEVLARKRRTYEFVQDTELRFLLSYERRFKPYLLNIQATVRGEYLFELLCVVSDRRLYGCVLVVTDSQKLRSRYSPFVLAHVEGLRCANQLELDQVDYGIYYEYKNVFNQPPTWSGGFRYLAPPIL